MLDDELGINPERENARMHLPHSGAGSYLQIPCAKQSLISIAVQFHTIQDGQPGQRSQPGHQNGLCAFGLVAAAEAARLDIVIDGKAVIRIIVGIDHQLSGAVQ